MSRTRVPPIVVALSVVLVFLAGAQYPYFRSDGGRPILWLVVLINVLARTRARRVFEAAGEAIDRHETVKNLLLAASSVIVLVGALEIGAELLVRTGLAEPYDAMTTMVRPGSEDFRMAHVTADEFRVPDPVLLWRPVDRWPYSSQQLKGPVAETPKPAGVFRIMCYGDSNTDGPNEGGWPEVLDAILAERHADSGIRIEVLNAGVAGYSSHQGLARFRQQVARFEPDLVTVSFGYNDIAPALGTPDKDFRLPPAPLVAAQRQLLRYSFYRVAEKLARRWAPERPPSVGERVPLEDYRANMEGFLDTGREHGARVVLLTRPHAAPRAELEKVDHNWRGRIPRYNRSLLELRQRGATVIDVQDHFERHHPTAFYDDCHFTLEGHARMAELLAAELAEAGLLP